MIKLIASDIDGTLVQDGTTGINQEIFEIVTQLHKKGIHFATASGRSWVSIEELFKPVKKKVFYISDNGAYLGIHGRNLFIHEMERGIVTNIIEDIKASDKLKPVVAGPDCYYLEESDQKFVDWLVKGYHANVKIVDDLTKIDDKIIKVSAYSPSSNIYEDSREIYEKYSDKILPAFSGSMWLDCNAKGVNKGEAIRALQESLGISPQETMVFGDQGNDVSMLKSAYYSFAVANAIDEAKAAARFEADSNLNDGVIKILKLLL